MGLFMSILGIFSLVFGLVVYAAHALRLGDMGLSVAMLSLIGLIISRRRYAIFVLGPVLFLIAGAFAFAAYDFVAFRRAFGLPYVRLAIIMSIVVALCLAGGIFSFSRRALQFFHRDQVRYRAQAVAFWLTVGLLFMAKSMAKIPVLLIDRFAPGWGPLEIVLLGFYAAWLGGKMLDAQDSGKIRSRYWAVFCLVFFVQLGLGLCGETKFLMTGSLHLPVPALIVAGPIFRGGGYFMPILYISTVFIVGAGWCSHLCYIGAADNLCARHGRRTPKKLSQLLPYVRVATLFLSIALALGLRLLGVGLNVAIALAAVFGLVGIGVMVTLSRATGVMVHCVSYCPIGIIGNVLGKLSPWRIKIGPGCDGCGRCSRACRYLALSPVDLAKGQAGLSCTLCGDCLQACPGGRLGYRFPGLSADAARTAYFTLVVSLHAVFLGVARI